jgi:glycosyltransferase involved in cell wall biosynthesis
MKPVVFSAIMPPSISDPRPRVSLVMPAYNEEENLEEAVAQARHPLEAITPHWEIVIVNDGSTDATGTLADRLATTNSQVRVVHHAHNRGLGGALATGFHAANGEILAYCDSDLPFDMQTLKAAYTLMQAEQADVVAGYRLGREGEGFRRKLYSVVYNRLIRTLFGLRVRDVNFSLKLFRRALIERDGFHSTGSFIDAEILLRAHRYGFRIAQLGVDYTPRTRGISTLSRPSVIVGILKELTLYKVGRLEGRTSKSSAEPVSRPVAAAP